MLELILGGARSGKSSLALARAQASGLKVVFIATATASDAEMRERISRHIADRPPHWTTIESPARLAQSLSAAARPDSFVIVDCLTLWIANVLFPEAHATSTPSESEWEVERREFFDALPQLGGDAVFVSNEVGLGIVPDSAVGRRFRDEQGRLNQQLAAICDRVTFVAAGLPLTLKTPNAKT
jgi:adenosylcobinamide kinase/adenosylcobinamide-phosphate guanylyltransferase